MFLDEELESIQKEDISLVDKVHRMQIAWCDRLPKQGSYKLYADAIKRIDSSWRLFCSRHKEYKPDGFRNFMKPKSNGTRDKADELMDELNRAYLHWW